jgi:hypothetical protein
MSPAPKYRERTCNTKTEKQGVGDGVGFGTVEGWIYAVTEHVEGTGVAVVADGYGAEGLRFRWAEILRFAKDDNRAVM